MLKNDQIVLKKVFSRIPVKHVGRDESVLGVHCTSSESTSQIFAPTAPEGSIGLKFASVSYRQTCTDIYIPMNLDISTFVFPFSVFVMPPFSVTFTPGGSALATA